MWKLFQLNFGTYIQSLWIIIIFLLSDITFTGECYNYFGGCTLAVIQFIVFSNIVNYFALDIMINIEFKFDNPCNRSERTNLNKTMQFNYHGI